MIHLIENETIALRRNSFYITFLHKVSAFVLSPHPPTIMANHPPLNTFIVAAISLSILIFEK